MAIYRRPIRHSASTIAICGMLTLASLANRPTAGAVETNPMPVGVDDAGSKQWIYDDATAQDAFERIGFSFLVHHFWGEPHVAEVDRVDRWAAKGGYGFLINQESCHVPGMPRNPALYRKPGHFFDPPETYVRRCLSSPRFLGFCYDEGEHWICNGALVTGGGSFVPHFYDAEGGTLEDAYQGNLLNLQVLMERTFAGFAERARQPGRAPIVGTENVFPILQHLFARAGMVQMPKLLKETITPVTLAMAMGAAKQYGVQHWTSVDLWMGSYPGHSPDELFSALLISYWTGAERTYIENFNYQDSLYRAREGRVELSPHGRVARQFIREYLPAHPRRLRFEDFSPEVILVRFPDSDWGQENPGPWIRRNLYGASNLVPDEDTRCWLKVWHVISHGTIPIKALNYNTPLGIPYRVLFPANNVAVYDHLAADPRLYASAKLVFLVGKQVSPECLRTLEGLARRGVTVVSTRRLAPRGMDGVGSEGLAVYPSGSGQWIVTDDVTLPAVKAMLTPYLGRPQELRYVFGATEVVFTTPEEPAKVRVEVRKR